MGAGAALRVITVGRTRAAALAALEDDFLKRCAPFATVERRTVAAGRQARPADRRREEAQKLREQLRPRGLAVALDSRGRTVDSAEFGRLLAAWRERGAVDFLIGGPDGFDAALVDECAATLSLSALTFPHELALVVLLEQIYRALAAAAGHPYSRH